MNIEIIKTSQTQNIESSLDSVRNFGLILNKTTSIIRMMHWFVCDYNTHQILGNLYSELNESFDTLQEEIIGTSKIYNITFPSFNTSINQLENIEMYNGNENILNYFHDVVGNLKVILTSMEFNDYTSKVKSGINNTKEEIISAINKACYLISILE